MKYGKWIAGTLGWAFGGPIGGLLGFTLGSVFDNASSDVAEWGPNEGARSTRRTTATQTADFEVSLLILSAAMMKADGRILKSELNYVKTFLTRQFGEERAKDQLIMLRGFLQQAIDLDPICGQIKLYMDMPSKRQLMHYLFGIARADNDISTPELKMLSSIAGALGLKHTDFASIKAMFITDATSDYKMLNITRNVSDEEVKKAYRSMAKKFHPDKVSHLGEEHQSAAKEKFQIIQDAYERVKKERGMN
jgi:DnaJ like chaperone protein